MAFTKLIVLFVIIAIAALGVEGSPIGVLAQQPAKLFGTFLGGDKRPEKPLTGLDSELREQNPLQGMRSTDGLSKVSESASTLVLGTDPSKLTGGEGPLSDAVAQQPAKLFGTFLGGDKSPVKPLTGLINELRERNPLQRMRSKVSESASTLGLGTEPSKLTGGEGSPAGALAQQPAKLFGTFLGGDKSSEKPLTGLASKLRERKPLRGMRPTDGLSKESESASTLGLGTDPSKMTELASGTPGHNLLSHGTSGMDALNTPEESASRLREPLGSKPELLPGADKTPFKLF